MSEVVVHSLILSKCFVSCDFAGFKGLGECTRSTQETCTSETEMGLAEIERPVGACMVLTRVVQGFPAVAPGYFRGARWGLKGWGVMANLRAVGYAWSARR